MVVDHINRQGISLGTVGSDYVLPSLQRSFLRQIVHHHDATILDVGANVGESSWAFLQSFTAWPQRLDPGRIARGTAFHHELAEELKHVRVLAFEPVRETFDTLGRHAQQHGWLEAGFTAFNAAVGAHSGDATIYFRNATDPLRRQASLSIPSSVVNMEHEAPSVSRQAVQVYSLWDLAQPNLLNFTRGVFLLKIDTEGFDPHVLVGAKPLLRAHAIKWVVFEFNRHWSVVPLEQHALDLEGTGAVLSSLEAVVSWLYDLGYWCYLLSMDLMVPLWGDYWDPTFQTQGWSNVFCGLHGHELRSVVSHYNSNAPWAADFTLPACHD